MSGLCRCGSGLYRWELRDARGIGCGLVCDRCVEARKAGYRPEIFDDARYEADEPIDED